VSSYSDVWHQIEKYLDAISETKIVLKCPNGYHAKLDGLVEDFLRDGVAYVGVIGRDCTRVEDIIDELLVGNGTDKNRIILTASHPGESIDDAIYFALSLTGDYAGEDYQIVEL
jgi:hypothetical protein